MNNKIPLNKNKLKPILRKRRTMRAPIKQVSRFEIGGNETSATVKQKKDLQFAGPIKIIIVDPKSEYCKTVWCAIGIALSNVAIGAVIMSIYHYTLMTDDVHAVVCSVAVRNLPIKYTSITVKVCDKYHFFSAQAILALNYANGWSTPMRTRHRRFAHIFLHVCGIICAITGTVLVTISKGISSQPHGITGIATGVLVLLSAILGPFALTKKKLTPLIFHMSLGIPAFIMSSLCVCFGLVLDPFKKWAGDIILFSLIALVTFYTVFIVTSSFMKCVSRI